MLAHFSGFGALVSLFLLAGFAAAVGSHGSVPTSLIIVFFASLAATVTLLLTAILVGTRALRRRGRQPTWTRPYVAATVTIVIAASAVVTLRELGYGGDWLVLIADLLGLSFFVALIAWNRRIDDEFRQSFRQSLN